MEPLTWFRVNCGIIRNRKTLALLTSSGGERAFNVFIFGLGYCGEQASAGFIPTLALPLIHGTPRHAKLLVQVGFWDECPGGWEVHKYAEYQPVDAAAKARSEKARKAAEARWGMRDGRQDGAAF